MTLVTKTSISEVIRVDELLTVMLHVKTTTQILEVIGVLDEPLIVAQQYSEAIAQFLIRGGGDFVALWRCFMTCHMKCTQISSQVTHSVEFRRTS